MLLKNELKVHGGPWKNQDFPGETVFPLKRLPIEPKRICNFSYLPCRGCLRLAYQSASDRQIGPRNAVQSRCIKRPETVTNIRMVQPFDAGACFNPAQGCYGRKKKWQCAWSIQGRPAYAAPRFMSGKLLKSAPLGRPRQELPCLTGPLASAPDSTLQCLDGSRGVWKIT